MYLLDHKLSHYLNEFSEELHNTYLLTNNTTTNTRKNRTTKNALKCLVYNLAYNKQHHNLTLPIPLSPSPYSNPLIYDGVLVNRKVSYKGTKEVLEWLGSRGDLEVSIGGVSSWKFRNGVVMPAKTEKSLTTITGDILKTLSIPAEPILPKSSIELRGVDKKPLERHLRKPQRELRSLIRDSNERSPSFDVKVGEESYSVHLKKVFSNGSWKQGGRSYCVGPKSPILLEKKNREVVTMRGEETVEVDYKALHPSIIAELGNLVLGDEFDPYDIPQGRSVGKVCLIVMLNAGNGSLALNAISNETGWSKPLMRKAMNCILERNPYIKPWVDNPDGLTLQYLDSQILDNVIKYCNTNDIPFIPVHDSLVVPRKNKSEIVGQMIESYEKVLGSNYNCKVV